MTDEDTATGGRLLSDFMGLTITLFPNRVEYTVKRFLSIKKESIPLRNIEEVDVEYTAGMASKAYLRIKTKDGKTHDLGATMKGPEVHEAIVEAAESTG